MRRRIAISLLATLAALAAAAVASAELSQSGNLRISFDGDFSPRTLPRDHRAPVTVRVEGSITTTDGTHPPPLRRLEIALNRNGRISTEGLPACTAALLQSTSTQRALERCRPALVGRGSFGATLASETAPVPASGEVLAFNGRRRGRPALLLHLYVAVPARVTFVLPLSISRRTKGQFGTVLSAKVPKLAGGLGSITHIRLEIGRGYSYRGRRLSFLSASCAAPAGFPGAVFSFARGSFHFSGHRTLDTTLTRDCHVR